MYVQCTVCTSQRTVVSIISMEKFSILQYSSDLCRGDTCECVLYTQKELCMVEEIMINTYVERNETHFDGKYHLVAGGWKRAGKWWSCTCITVFPRVYQLRTPGFRVVESQKKSACFRPTARGREECEKRIHTNRTYVPYLNFADCKF